jgi:hypothetical protein
MEIPGFMTKEETKAAELSLTLGLSQEDSRVECPFFPSPLPSQRRMTID